MVRDEFYHEFLRKYVAIFGTLFNDITISRDTIITTRQQQFKVPISYGPREKYIARLEGDPSGERDVAITLPRISFEMTSMQYAANRKLNTMNQIVVNDDSVSERARKQVWQPVPYDIFFQLNIMTKTMEDGAKIVEQILPHFTPDWTVSAKLLDQMPDIVLDVPVVLNSVQSTDLYEGDFISRRMLLWTLDFTMKAQFFGPIRESKVIKLTKINLYNNTTETSAERDFERVVLRAGQTPAGNPTTYASNTGFIQATATAAIANGSISTITITEPGFGYETANTTVTFSGPVTGHRARGNVIVRENRIVGIDVINPGSGYATEPTVTISPPNLGSIPYIQIDENEPHGYAVTIESSNE